MSFSPSLSDAEAKYIRSGIFIFLHGLVVSGRDNEKKNVQEQWLTGFLFLFKIIEWNEFNLWGFW